MINIKNKFKRFFSLLAVALIIVSSLPISASAASRSLKVNFSLWKSMYSAYVEYPEEVEAAIMSLEIQFIDSNNNDRSYDYTGSTFSINVYSGDDYDQFGWHVRIVNPSNYEFRFELVVPSTYSFGVQTIPAASDGVPGVYTLDLSTVYSKVSNPSALTFWFREVALPPLDRTDYNDNYAQVNIYTGSTLYKTQKVYAPQRTVGAYSDTIYNLCRSGDLNLPDELNGYKIDKQEYDFNLITIDPDKVNTYNVYYDLKINLSYTIFYAVTPNGRQEISRFYAPSDWIGDYTTDVQELYSDGIFVPWFVDGYQFNSTVSPEYITVYSDRVTEVDLYYTDIGADKTLTINYYDQNGKIINQVEYRVSSLGSSFKIPSKDGYLFAPSSVQLTLGHLSESFDVYMIDFTGEREAAYQIGFGEGQSAALSQFNKEILDAQDKAYSNGYQVGLKDGYNNNERFQEELSRLRKEYNIFTSFFDGIFGGLNSSYDTIVDGIAIGGIKLRSFIATILVAIICYFVIKVII